MLKLNNISKQYNKEPALFPFSYESSIGKTSIVIGPSGSGKSTLLRLITGLLNPDTGEILLGEIVMSEKTLPELRKRMGYVIQEGGLFPHLTAKANVAVMPVYLRWEDERINSRIEELSALVQLPAELLSRYPTELSGGERQRVSLMRALMLDPELLLLDEPLGSLDPMIRFDLQHELKAIFGQLGKSVIMVTHDIGEAAFFGDEILLLREGKVVQQGTIVDLLENPADDFVARFIKAQRPGFETHQGRQR